MRFQLARFVDEQHRVHTRRGVRPLMHGEHLFLRHRQEIEIDPDREGLAFDHRPEVADVSNEAKQDRAELRDPRLPSTYECSMIFRANEQRAINI